MRFSAAGCDARQNPGPVPGRLHPAIQRCDRSDRETNPAEIPVAAGSVAHLTSIGSRLTLAAPAQKPVEMASENQQTSKTTNKCLQQQAAGSWIQICENAKNRHFRGPAKALGKNAPAVSFVHSGQFIQQASPLTKKPGEGFGQSQDFAVVRIRLAAAGDCGHGAGFAF